MSITIRGDAPRTIRAIEIADEADQWIMYRNQGGQQVYGVPSQSEPRRYYLVTLSSCDCPDFERNAPASVASDDPSELRACKHMLAVRLHCELVRAQQLQPRRATPTERRRGHLRLGPQLLSTGGWLPPDQWAERIVTSHCPIR